MFLPAARSLPRCCRTSAHGTAATGAVQATSVLRSSLTTYSFKASAVGTRRATSDERRATGEQRLSARPMWNASPEIESYHPDGFTLCSVTVFRWSPSEARAGPRRHPRVRCGPRRSPPVPATRTRISGRRSWRLENPDRLTSSNWPRCRAQPPSSPRRRSGGRRPALHPDCRRVRGRRVQALSNRRRPDRSGPFSYQR